MLRTQAFNFGKDICFLTVILTLFFFLFLGERPLFVPDEGRYAEIAREMLTSHHFITPHLNGIKYFEKPVLFYWLTAFVMHIGGCNLLTARFVNALLGLLGCLFTYYAASRLYDRKVGLLAAFILSTNCLYFIMSHMVTLDLPVTFFISASLFSFMISVKNASTRHFYCWLAAIFAALAVLTKGLIGIVFPCLIIFVWLLCVRQWHLLKTLPLKSALITFLVIVVPWHLLISYQNPEFLYFYFVTQHIARYLSPEVGHYQPIWYFIPILAISFFPWSIFLPRTLINFFISMKTTKDNRAFHLFLFIWIIAIFLFFSFSKSKLIPYILPIFPPLSILVANEVINHMKFTDFKFYMFIGSTMVFLLVVLKLMPALDQRSIQPLAKIIQAQMTMNDEIVAYDYYQDLPFYLNKKINVVNWHKELLFGIKHQANHAWMLDEKTFWEHFQSPKKLFIVSSCEHYEKLRQIHGHEPIFLIAKTARHCLFSNQMDRA